MPVLGEELVVFGSSFDRSWFLSGGANIENVTRAVSDKLPVKLSTFAWLSGHGSKAFVAAGQAGEHSFDTEVVHFSPGFSGRPLHDDPYKVVGDLHHDHALTRHFRSFDGEVFHPKGCLEVTKFEFDLPTLHVKVGKFLCGVGFGVEEVGDDDESCFFSGSVQVSHLDVAQGESCGKLLPFFLTQF